MTLEAGTEHCVNASRLPTPRRSEAGDPALQLDKAELTFAASEVARDTELLDAHRPREVDESAGDARHRNLVRDRVVHLEELHGAVHPNAGLSNAAGARSADFEGDLVEHVRQTPQHAGR